MKNITESIQDFFDNRYNELRKKIEPVEVLRQEFVGRFPENQIHNMKLDDYVVGKKAKSFCYWLETTLKPLGSIKGGSPADKKFGVYFNKKTNEYKTISKWDKDENSNNAFIKIKDEISNLLLAGKNKDIDSIIKNEISPMFKYKILTSYYPDAYLSVFSEAHVDYFLSKLDVKYNQKLHVEQKRKILFEYKDSVKKFNDIDNYYFTAFLYWWNNPKIKEIRLLPMSKDEFPNWLIEEVQNDFLLDQLINDDEGYFNYAEKGMNAMKGALVLFQYDNHIIGSAKLLDVVKHEEPIEGVYKGAYLFDVDSIKTFEPISSDDLKKIDGSFKKFSQAKQSLDSSIYTDIMVLIQEKSGQTITEEILEEEAKKYIEGAKSKITVNAYERNPKARRECIRIHGSSCMICGFDFAEVYGEQFEGKIHVHHKIPLHEIYENYEVDPANDLIPVCPNCHMILHSKLKGTYTVEEVKKMLKKELVNSK